MNETDSGQILPGNQRYIVTYTHNHKTLNKGDLVTCRECPNGVYLCLVKDDYTIHGILASNDQYVHLIPA